MATSATVRPKLVSVNPATGEVLAEFEPATDADVIAAVARAKEAAGGWVRLGIEERAKFLLRLQAAVYARRREIARTISLETGKPLVESLSAEVLLVLDACQYYAKQAARFLKAEHVPHHNLAVKGKRGWLEYRPYGVIGIISPSNFPFSIPFNEMIPALVAGNSVVLKPSELTPQVGVATRECLEAAGFPAGVASVILGDGPAGAALAHSPIDKLIFTGSVATGKRIQAAAAERLLPTVLELGGKDPMIVCADADLDRASSGAVWGAFTNAGQACLSVERLYVVRDVSEQFIRQCVEKTKKLKLGSPQDPDTDVGPLIRERQVRIVEEHLRDAVEKGADVLVGGRRPAGENTGGFFFEPTVVTRVHHGMKIMREETFGPVLPIQVVSGEAEAVRLANDSELGLSASVWTRDLAKGAELARRIEAGSVMVNDCVSYFGICEAPHGGVKRSGLGRTHSRLGLMEMVQVKYLDVDVMPRLPKVWWFGYDTKTLALMNGFVDFLFAPRAGKRAQGLMGIIKGWRKRGI
jgi:acyl-CoA reductase-like NAD-dependent aldehyde dehydrogenase